MNKSFYNFEKIEVRGLFYFNFFNRNVQSKHVYQLAYNGLQLTEVGDYEAQTFKLKQMMIRSNTSQITNKPPILVRCCYAMFLFTN